MESVTLTFDVWTSQHTTTSYLGGTAHYLNGIEMESCVLGVVELTEAHTASYLSEMMEKMCADWEISKAQIVLVITDNAENIKKAATDTFGLSKHAPCFDHTLNLIPTYSTS